MQILTAAEMKATDQRTAEEFGVSLSDMMENAGNAVARFILRHHASAKKIVVLCGKGNNGGDGMVAARILRDQGREVTAMLLGSRGAMSREAIAALGEDVLLEPDEQHFEMPEVKILFEHADLFVDAVFGTGFKPPLRGIAVAVRNKLAKLKTPVVAVDLPSGWDADSMAAHAEGAFRADAVVTFTAPKLAHIFGMLTDGPIVVAQIGSPPEAVQSTSGLYWAGASKKIAEVPRQKDGNKGKFGHVLVVAGSWGKAGAAAMASMAALRCGAGLVTAAVPESILNTVSRFMAELMTTPLKETTNGTISSANLGENLDRLLERRTAIAIGPGISQDTEAAEYTRQVVTRSQVPVVIDADALAAFAEKSDLLRARQAFAVMTPHPGEMARLIGKTVQEVEFDRLKTARDFARQNNVTLVLKGWRTLIAHPDGRVAVNTTGNPGMAKGGSGDILTGIVVGMLAQFHDQPQAAVEAGVFLHGLAADFAVLEQDEHTLCATDTVSHLWRAFRAHVEDEDGFTWLQGLAR
ncbi:MAG TPA: NAD(P)H-hydrate dehydratase [Acidobacteriaceae bacterium]|nr:NAD(P)H-hydrate dehydratase [Acidobacteriaceae bacterium]